MNLIFKVVFKQPSVFYFSKSAMSLSSDHFFICDLHVYLLSIYIFARWFSEKSINKRDVRGIFLFFRNLKRKRGTIWKWNESNPLLWFLSLVHSFIHSTTGLARWWQQPITTTTNNMMVYKAFGLGDGSMLQ